MSTRTIDDHDPSVTYSSGWGPQGGPNEYDGTTTGTGTQGSSATLRFSGISVSVFGTITNIGLGTTPHTTFTIDNNPPTTYIGNQQPAIQYKVQFFQSPTLSPGDHALVVTLASGNGSILYLDYFEIVPSPTVFVPPALSMGGSSVGGGAGSTAVIGSSSLLTTSSTVLGASSSSGATTTSSRISQGASISALAATVTVTEAQGGITAPASASVIPSSSTASNRQPVGPIIGGVLGGVLILLLAVLGVLFLLIRRRNRPQLLLDLQNAAKSNGASSTRQVTPFNHTITSPAPGSGFGDTAAISQPHPQPQSPGKHWTSTKFPPLPVDHWVQRQPDAPSSEVPSNNSETSSSTYPAGPDGQAAMRNWPSYPYPYQPAVEKVATPRVVSRISNSPSVNLLRDPPPSYNDS